MAAAKLGTLLADAKKGLSQRPTDGEQQRRLRDESERKVSARLRR